MLPSPDWVATRLRGFFTLSASPPITAGSATAFGDALAPRYGSDLLTLKLPSPRSRTISFVTPSKLRRVLTLCRACPLHAIAAPLRASDCGSGPCGGVVPPEQRSRAGWQ